MFRKYQNLFTALTVFCISGISVSSAYGESPRLDSRFSDLKLPLGAGYDAVLGEPRIPSCVVVQSTKTSCPNNICGSLQETKFKASFASGFKEIHEILDYDISVDVSFAAQFEVFGAEGSSHLDFAKSQDKKTSRDNTKYIISAEKLFSSAFVDKYELKPEYKKLLKDGEYSSFREICGTHFVGAQTREGSGLLILTADFIDNKSKDLFELHFMSEFQGDFFDVVSADSKMSSNLKFSKEIIEKAGNVTLTFRGRGGDDSKTKILSAGGLVKEFGPVVDEFQAFMNTVDAKKSAIGHHYLTSYRVIDPKIPSEFANEDQVSFLKQIMYMRMDLIDNIDKIKENIKQAETQPNLSAEYVSTLRSLKREMESQNIRLSEMAKTCISEEKQCNSGAVPDEIDMNKVFYLGDVISGAEITPACQYKDSVLEVVKIGLNGRMPFKEHVYDIKIDWITPKGSSGRAAFAANQHLTFGDAGKFAMTLDTIRKLPVDGQSASEAAEALLDSIRDRYYIIKVSTKLLPIAKTYIMRSGVGAVNCPVRQ